MFFTLDCHGHVPVPAFISYSTVLRSSYVVIKYAAFKEHAGQGFTLFKFVEKSILKISSELLQFEVSNIFY